MGVVVSRPVHIRKSVKPGTPSAEVPRGVVLEASEGEPPSIPRPAGGGRSTPMNFIGRPANPAAGLYIPDGRDVPPVKDRELSAFRNTLTGFAFQPIDLPGRLTALENPAAAPVRRDPGAIRRPARRMPKKVCMMGWPGDRPNEASGRQRHRAAVVRELAGQPSVVLADEPAGDRVSQTAEAVMQLPIRAATARRFERQAHIRREAGARPKRQGKPPCKPCAQL